MRNLLGPLAATLLMAGTCCGADEFPEDLAKWVVTAPPKEKDDDRWRVANWDITHHWVVSLRAGVPSAKLGGERREQAPSPLPFAIEKGTDAEGLAGRRISVKVDDGWIVGFNAGEWGGWLWWFSPDGSRRYKIASDCWVNEFVATDAGLLVVEGLAHMGVNRGGIVRLTRKDDGRWHSEAFVALNEKASCVAKDADGTLLVATWRRLLRVNLTTKKVDVLVAGAFWGGLYPTSMVVTPRGTTYLGMRHGVAKVEKQGGTYRVDWLLPTADFDKTSNARRGLP
jgi:hypothetical protein